MWKTPSLLCPLNFSSNVNGSATRFNINWILNKIVNGTGSANIEIKKLLTEMSTLLTEKDKSARKKLFFQFTIKKHAPTKITVFFLFLRPIELLANSGILGGVVD